jgi:predicted chitinase
MITRALIERLAPRPKDKAKAKIWDGYVDALLSPEGQALLMAFGISSKLRLAHILAQWLHESGGLTLIWESSAYSAKRIMEIFGVGRHSAKVTWAEASRLAYNGPALFDRVYGIGNPKKARELGNKDPGDGYRYRGCGIVQLTGRADHEKCAKKIGCKVDEIERPINSIHAALIEWKAKGCNGLADADNFLAITKRINGGTNGLNARRMYLARAKRLLEDMDEAEEMTPVPVPPVRPEPVEKEAPLPPPPGSTRPKDLAPVSKKISVLMQIRAFVAFVLTSLGSLLTMDSYNVAKGFVTDVKELALGNAVYLMAAACLVVWLVARWLERRTIKDYDEGRYIPSGSET